jgi:hypothetical protein
MQEPEFANPKLQHLPIEVRSNTHVNEVIGKLLSLLSLPIIPIGIIGTIMLLYHRRVSGCILPLAIAITGSLVIHIRRLSRRYLANPQRKMLKDARDPVLYLRAFNYDLNMIPRSFDKKTHEEKLTSVLDLVGPVLAFGKPGEKGLPLPGATRVYTRDNVNWQPVVKELMKISKLVVINAGIGKGLIWELEAAKSVVKPKRLLISFLHWQSYRPVIRQKRYEEFSNYFEKVFGHRLPAESIRIGLMRFDADWVPFPIEILPEYPDITPLPFLPRSLFYDLSAPSSKIRDTLIHILKEQGLING